MTVYVDNMRRPARVGRISARWSHLFADSRQELDAFAAAIGMNPAWIQHAGTHREHYDVTDSRRTAAIRAGAVQISYPRETGELIASRNPHPLTWELSPGFLMTFEDTTPQEQP